jgi:hypothetical protein
LLITSWLLTLGKQINNIWAIVIREVIYQLVGYTFAIKFKDTFAKHFSPH